MEKFAICLHYGLFTFNGLGTIVLLVIRLLGSGAGILLLLTDLVKTLVLSSVDGTSFDLKNSLLVIYF